MVQFHLECFAWFLLNKFLKYLDFWESMIFGFKEFPVISDGRGPGWSVNSLLRSWNGKLLWKKKRRIIPLSFFSIAVFKTDIYLVSYLWKVKIDRLCCWNFWHIGRLNWNQINHLLLSLSREAFGSLDLKPLATISIGVSWGLWKMGNVRT